MARFLVRFSPWIHCCSEHARPFRQFERVSIEGVKNQLRQVFLQLNNHSCIVKQVKGNCHGLQRLTKGSVKRNVFAHSVQGVFLKQALDQSIERNLSVLQTQSETVDGRFWDPVDGIQLMDVSSEIQLMDDYSRELTDWEWTSELSIVLFTLPSTSRSSSGSWFLVSNFVSCISSFGFLRSKFSSSALVANHCSQLNRKLIHSSLKSSSFVVAPFSTVWPAVRWVVVVTLAFVHCLNSFASLFGFVALLIYAIQWM